MRVLLFFFLSCSLSAQDIRYARNVIDLLSSESLHGRGYVRDGHLEAAKYIASEFEHFGLQSFSLNYQQKFPIKVNTFPKKASLTIGERKLQPGRDFLADPSSPGIRGSYQTLVLEIDTLLKNTSEWVKVIKETTRAIVLDRSGYDHLNDEDRQIIDHLVEVFKYNRTIKAPMYLEVTDRKLLWGASQVVSPRACFTVKRSALGPTSLEKIRVNLTNVYQETESQNVIGLIEGERSDSLIMITAHYDHLGRLGRNAYFPGANDNASGVAMLLNLAQHFSFSEKPPFSLLFVAFGGEEAGLVGSQYYVERPLYPLKKVKLLINLDIVGTGDDGITVVNGKVYPEQFDLLKSLNNDLIPDIKARGSACNSDHCPFDRASVPSFYLYTRGGIEAYHHLDDQSSTLPLTEYEDLFTLLTRFVAAL